MNRFERETEEDYLNTFSNYSTGEKHFADSIDLDEIEKRSKEIRAEVSKPHKCGKGCLCVALKINLDIIDIHIKHARTLAKSR